MSQPSTIPQQLMTSALLHFEQGVPIDDCDCRKEHKHRLARVSHVYWIWKRNPLLETFAMFKQLVRGHGADKQSEWRMAKKDQMLFEFVRDHVAPSSRQQDEAVVRAAANQAIRIGMETDNAVALTKGGKLLYDVAHLGQPESEQADMAKANFLQPIVTTTVTDVDETKIDYDDKQSLAIMNEFGAYIDPKRQMMEDKVALLEAKSNPDGIEEIIEENEQDRNKSDE